jgi:hypothetical protein
MNCRYILGLGRTRAYALSWTTRAPRPPPLDHRGDFSQRYNDHELDTLIDLLGGLAAATAIDRSKAFGATEFGHSKHLRFAAMPRTCRGDVDRSSRRRRDGPPFVASANTNH